VSGVTFIMSPVDLNESTNSVDSDGSWDGTENLKSDLQSIANLVNKLKNFKPETIKTPVKKKRGRPAKSKSSSPPNSASTGASTQPMVSSEQSLDTIPEILGKICNLNIQILDKLESLQSENRSLRRDLESIIPTSEQPSNNQHPSTAPIPARSSITSNTRIDAISSRLDQL